jgi:hypothetical protein
LENAAGAQSGQTIGRWAGEAGPRGPTHDRKREVEERDWQQPRKGSIAIQSERIDLFARSSATRIEQDHPIRGKDDKVIARLIHDIQNA